MMDEELLQRVAEAISKALPPYFQARGALDPTGAPPYWSPDGIGTQALARAAVDAVYPNLARFVYKAKIGDYTREHLDEKERKLLDWGKDGGRYKP